MRDAAGIGPGPWRAALRLFYAALMCLSTAGCGPSDPLDLKVDAANYPSFSIWRSQAERTLTPQQLGDFNQAVQEIRFHVMADGKATGSEAVEDAMLQMIDGRSVRQVLQLGLGWELQRAEAERSALESSMKLNARMRTRPGDSDSANYLSDLHDRQAARLQAATDEVTRVHDRLAAAGSPAGVAGEAPTPIP